MYIFDGVQLYFNVVDSYCNERFDLYWGGGSEGLGSFSQ